jgi:hypothetical protein
MMLLGRHATSQQKKKSSALQCLMAFSVTRAVLRQPYQFFCPNNFHASTEKG